MPKPLKILQASAGSGKTYSLTIHYIILMFTHENKYKEILGVTFTNNATNEMKERILKVLKGLATNDNSKEINSYRNQILSSLKHLNKDTISSKADIIYRKILHDYSRFSISTIDGFVQRVIRGFSFELGLDSNYSIELNETKVKEDLLAMLEENLNENKDTLEWIIKIAISKINDNKNWDYKKELLSLIGEIFKDSYDNFDKALALIGKDNIDKVFKDLLNKINTEITNYEKDFKKLSDEISICVDEEFNNDFKDLVGVSRHPVLKFKKLKDTTIRVKDLMKLIDDVYKLKNENFVWFKEKKERPEFLNTIKPLLSNFYQYFEKNSTQYLFNKEVIKNFYYLKLMQEIANLLSLYRQQTGKILISDAQYLINGITNPIDENGDEINDENPSFIWEKIGNKYRHFLIDEFQDTSLKQWKNFKSLLSNTIAAPSTNYYDHLIVGDTKQSIYRFRGGDWNILQQQVANDIGINNIAFDNLAENFRSSTNIINFNNSIFPTIANILQGLLNLEIKESYQDIKDWWAKNYENIIPDIYKNVEQEIPKDVKEGGIVKVKAFNPPTKKEESSTEKIDTEEVSKFYDFAITEVINEITTLCSEEYGYQYNEIGILARKKSELSLIVSALLEANIPVLSNDALRIDSHPAIELIIEILRLLSAIESESALYKANCIALYYRLQNKEIPAEAFFNLNNKSISQLEPFLPSDLCKHWQEWKTLPMVSLLEQLFTTFELEKSKSNWPYLLAFRDLVPKANTNGEKGIKSFLTWWDVESENYSLPNSEKNNAVQVMTIHKSKGLAFRAVFVPFCDWKITPKTNTKFWVPTKGTLLEELKSIPLNFSETLSYLPSPIDRAYYKELLDTYLDNLNSLYVAFTRAKDYLHVCLENELKNLNKIGEILLNALRPEEAEDTEENLEEDTTLAEETPLELYETLYEVIAPISSKPPEPSVIKTIELAQYTISNRLIAQYKKADIDKIPTQLLQNVDARFGSIKHEVLANTDNEEKAKEYLEQLVIEGIITQSDVQHLLKDIVAVFNHQELKSICSKTVRSLNEISIVNADGIVKRPDKIIFTSDEVIVIDYKFTLDKIEKHFNQVREYQNLLKEMGYSTVKGYLFYAINQELIAV